jgi:hypothetical protein
MEVEIDRISGVYHVAEKDDLVLTFLCKKITGSPRLAEDVAEFGWFEPTELPQPMRERHAERVSDALKRPGLVFRSES